MSGKPYALHRDEPVVISIRTAEDEICHIEENGDIIKDGKRINDDVDALASCLLELAQSHAEFCEKRKGGRS